MGKGRTKHIALIALALVAVLVWVHGLTVPVGRVSRRTQGQPQNKPRHPQQNAAQPVSLPERTYTEGRARTHTTGWDRNPFILPGEGSLGVEGLALNGIVWDDAYPMAMINDQVLGVGDKLGTREIVKITRTEVVLDEDGRSFTLKLGQ